MERYTIEELIAEPIVERSKGICDLVSGKKSPIHLLKQCKVSVWYPLPVQESKSQDMENAKTIIFYMSKGERSNCNSYISTSHPIIVDLVFVQIILTRLQKLAMCIYLETQSGFRLETSMIGMIFFLRQPQEKRISSMASPKHLIWSADRDFLSSF